MKRLVLFVVAAIIGIATANAQITQGRIGTGSITIAGSTTSDVYGLDFDNDGSDLEFRIADFPGSPSVTGGYLTYNWTDGGNNIVNEDGVWDYVAILDAGVTIGSSSEFEGQGDGSFNSSSITAGTHYMGFRISLDDGVHYGWAEYTVSENGSDYDIVWNKCFYNATVGASIETGDEGDSVPTPTLGTFVVADGSATNGMVPIYGYYADAYLRCQTIYPESMLTGIVGNDIYGITYYLTSPATGSWGNASFEVKIGTVGNSSFESAEWADVTSFTTVYTGALDGTVSELTISFTSPWTYTGGNLLIEVNNTVQGTYKAVTFAGMESENASLQNYSSSSWEAITATQRNFIPKTGFIVPVSCAQPSDLAVVAGETTASISWTENGSATQWQYKLDDGDWVTISENPYAISGLTANTAYTVQLRSFCSAVDQSFSIGSSFRTTCSAEAFPYTETFESYEAGTTSFPSCWTLAEGSSYVRENGTYSTYASQGSKALGMSVDATVVTPVINVAGNDVMVAFDLERSSASAGSMAVGFAVSPSLVSSAVWFDTIQPVDDSYHTYDYIFRNTLNVQSGCIVFKQIGSSSSYSYFYLDTLTVSYPPTCPKPINVAYTVDGDNVILSWTENGSATQWLIKVGDGDYQLVTTNPYPLTGLAANTQYTVELRAYCGGTDTSDAVSIEFRTPCNAFTTEDLPYLESFEDDFGCWEQEQVSGSYSWSLNSTYYTATHGSALANLNGSSRGSSTRLISPIFNLAGLEHAVLTFAHIQREWSGDQDSLVVEYRLNATDEWHRLASFTENVSDWQVEEVLLPEVSSSLQIAFHGYIQYGYGVAVDSVVLAEPPSCIKPTNLTAVATEDALELSWTENGTATQWFVKINGDEDYLTVTTNPYPLTGLAANTQYTVELRAYCGGTDTSDATTASFRTACGTQSLTYTDGFEGYTAGSGNMPPCWTSVSGSNYVQNLTTYAYNGSQALHMGGSDPVVATNILALNGSNIDVSFAIKREGPSSGTMLVGLATDYNDLSTAVWQDTIKPNDNNYSEYDYTFTNTAETGYIVFKQITSSSVYYYWIDDLSVSVASDCHRPESGTISNVSVRSADIEWAAVEGATGYKLAYSTGDDPESAIVSDVAATTKTLTDLTPETTYNVWVATACGASQSTWRSLGSFTTQIACAQVTNAAVTSVTGTAIALGWSIDNSVGGTSTAVEVSYKEADADEWTVYNTTDNFYIFSGLTEGTEYNFRLRNICSDDIAQAVTLTATTPVCGEVTGTESSSYIPTYNYYNYSYTQSIYTANETSTFGSFDTIMFYYAGDGSFTRTIDVYLADIDGASFDNGYIDIDQFTQVATDYEWNVSQGWNAIPLNTVFQHVAGNDIVVALNDKTGSYVYSISNRNFACHNGSAVYSFNDYTPYDPASPETPTTSNLVPNIRFNTTCSDVSCTAPIAALGTVTSTEVSASWTPLGSETSWSAEYRVTGETEWIVADDNVTTTSYTFTSLASATSYQFRIGANCNDEHAYASLAATTLCGVVTVTPAESYNQNFDNLSSDIPMCWSSEPTYNYYDWESYYNGYSGKALYFYGYNGYESRLVTPVFDLSELNNGAQVTFVYKMPSTSSYNSGDDINATLQFFYRTSSDDDWTPVTDGSFTEAANDWTEVELPLTASANAPYYQIAMLASSVADYSDTYVYIDEFVVEKLATCAKPRNLAVTTGANEAIISWTSDANNFEIQYSTDGTEWTSTSSSTTQATLTGLMSSTVYQFRVRAICAVGDTSSWASCSKATACDVIDGSSLPYFEGFENGINCWDQEFVSGTIEWMINNSITDENYNQITSYEGSSYIGIRNSNSNGEITRLVSPVFDLASFETVTLRFAHLQREWSGDQDRLAVEYRLSPDNEWQTLVSYNESIDTWQSENVQISELSSQFQLAFKATCMYGHGIAIDSLSLIGEGSSQPACDVPANMTTSNITATSVTVSWTGNAPQYEIYLTGGSQPISQIVTASPYTVEGLSPVTAYTVKMRAICDDEVYSNWNAGLSFTTIQQGEEPETCDVPTNITTSNITATSVTVSWTGTAVSYEVTVTGSGQPITQTVNENSCTIDGLSPAKSYQVKVRATCENGLVTDWSTPVTFYTLEGSGIDDINATYSVSLYPNPAKSEVTLRVEGLNGTATVSIIDMSGRTLMSDTLNGESLRLNVAPLAQGTYFVRVSGENISTVRKLVVR